MIFSLFLSFFLDLSYLLFNFFNVSVFVRRVEPRHFYGEFRYIKSVLLLLLLFQCFCLCYVQLGVQTGRKDRVSQAGVWNANEGIIV